MPAEPPSQLIDLALQGGGSHGAFTWGVLDRLLEERWLTIDGISGTSAGAMNAAVMADGHARAGNEGAREALEAFWRKVSDAAAFSPLQRSPLDSAARPLDARPFARLRRLRHDGARLLALRPRPSAANPLREILSESIDFDRLAAAPMKLFITATNVRTGAAARVPQRRADARRAARLGLPADHVPGGRDRRRGLLGRRLFRQPDHDPAGAANASRTTRSWSRSIRSSARASPRSARDILNRLNEVSFNAVLLKELRMIALLRQVADADDARRRAWAAHAHPHDRRATSWSSSVHPRSSTPNGRSSAMLRDEGRRAAEAFLAAHGDDLGKRSTLDIDACSKASEHGARRHPARPRAC